MLGLGFGGGGLAGVAEGQTEAEGEQRNSKQFLHVGIPEYCFYCEGNKSKAFGKNDFFKALENMELKATKTNGNWYFVIPYDKLQKLADTEKCICEYDEYEVDSPHGLDDGIIIEEDDKKEVVDEPDYKKLYEDTMKKLKELEDKMKPKKEEVQIQIKDEELIVCNPKIDIEEEESDDEDAELLFEQLCKPSSVKKSTININSHDS